ncbi:MAG: hypothetical protein WAV73_01660, partial [Candidatus Moraniibacteriota bacterium]
MENKIYTKKRNLSRGELGRVLVSRLKKKVKLIFNQIKLFFTSPTGKLSLIKLSGLILLILLSSWGAFQLFRKPAITQPKQLVTPYDWKVENPEDGYAIEFAQIKNEKSDIQIKKTKPENLKK